MFPTIRQLIHEVAIERQGSKNFCASPQVLKNSDESKKFCKKGRHLRQKIISIYIENRQVSKTVLPLSFTLAIRGGGTTGGEGIGRGGCPLFVSIPTQEDLVTVEPKAHWNPQVQIQRKAQPWIQELERYSKRWLIQFKKKLMTHFHQIRLQMVLAFWLFTMDETPLEVKKLKSGSAIQKGKTGRRKSENDGKEDNSLKVQVSKNLDKNNVVGEEDAGDSPIWGGSEDTLKSAVQLKRGADGEMMQAYLSSAEKDLSRCPPRKEGPIFRMVDLSEGDKQRIVGKRIKVYWPESRKWFVGRVQSFDRNRERHSILYDDGDKETLDLTKEHFELEIMHSEGFNLKFESRSHKKVGSFNGFEASENALDNESSESSDDKNSSGCPGTENTSALEKVCQTGENQPFDTEPEMEPGDPKGVAEIASKVINKLEAHVAKDGKPDTNTVGKTTMSNSSASEDKKTEGNLEDESEKEGGIRQGKIRGS